MKHKLFILTTFLLFASAITSFASLQKIEGNSFTDFGEYTLTETDQIQVVNNVAYQVWHLNYTNNITFEILCAPGDKTNCCFIARNNEFEIQYSREDGKFGVKLVDTKRSSIKKSVIMKKINQEQFANQQILTTNEKSKKEYLGLVACFLPLTIS